MNKPHLLFLYASKGIAKVPSLDWKTTKAGSRYNHTNQEGDLFMLKRLLDKKIISKLTIIYESNIEPGVASFIQGADNYVIPRLSPEILKTFIDSNTIIFVKGVARHWVDLLVPYRDNNWLLIYGNNTGKERWTWWDAVFDDLGLGNKMVFREKYIFPYIKPVNEDIFKFHDYTKKYDICIGASYIHDNKGQYLAVKLIEAFKEKYGYYPNCVMPGLPRRSRKTLEMLDLNFIQNECVMPGMVNRHRLAKIFNQSTIFIHFGNTGQNDKAVAEAWACGCKLIIQNPSNLSPCFSYDNRNIFLFNSGDVETNIDKLKMIMDHQSPDNDLIERQLRIENYKNHMGFQEKVMPRIELLFNTISGTHPCSEVKQRLPYVIENLIREGY